MLALRGFAVSNISVQGTSEGFTVDLQLPDQYSIVYVNTDGVHLDSVTARGIIKFPQVCLSLIPDLVQHAAVMRALKACCCPPHKRRLRWHACDGC